MRIYLPTWMRVEVELLSAALGFYTRLPVPASMSMNSAKLAASHKYLPAIGILVAGVSSLIMVLANKVWPIEIAIVLSMASSVVMTGAFHEDGLADSCDGFGGGYEAKQVIRIMRDSRIGSFGALGLMAVLSLKFLSLRSMGLDLAVVSLFIGHSLSRLVALLMRASLPYASEEGKVREAVIPSSGKELWLPSIIAAIPLIMYPQVILLMLVISLIVFLMARFYFTRRLGGYTGDALGALQQVTEVALLLGLTALQKF